MATPTAEHPLLGSPYLPGEGIRRGSELDKPGLRELAGDSADQVRMPLQHGHVDDVMPAWVVTVPTSRR